MLPSPCQQLSHYFSWASEQYIKWLFDYFKGISKLTCQKWHELVTYILNLHSVSTISGTAPLASSTLLRSKTWDSWLIPSFSWRSVSNLWASHFKPSSATYCQMSTFSTANYVLATIIPCKENWHDPLTGVLASNHYRPQSIAIF